MTPLAIAVFFGSAQNCLSKAAKYSVFDATKEMAYIPLDHESKLKGKAAIDGVGSRLGKSGGSVIHQSLLMIFETLPRSSPYIAAILGTMIVFWIGATKSLGRKFSALVAKQAKDSSVTEELEPSTPAIAAQPQPPSSSLAAEQA
jgi:AAA family ATP:ADP antiporter